HEVRGEAANVGAGVAQDARIPPATVHGPGMVAGNGHGGSQARRHRSSRPARRGDTETHMAKYLVSFPAAAMVVSEDEWDAVVRDSHAVIEEAKAAGVYVFGGGIDAGIAPRLVSGSGAVSDGGYPWAPPLD